MPLTGSELFINRELSWLAFNERVVAQADDPSLPLYERLRFFGIAAENLDEFFMVRVAGLKRQVRSGVLEAPADGLLPEEQLAAISEKVAGLLEEVDRVWFEGIVPLLASADVHLLSPRDLDEGQLEVAHDRFMRDVFPALTPIALDPGHPFPHLRNKTLNVALHLRRRGKGKRRNLHNRLYALVQVPTVLTRLLRVPHKSGRAYVMLEDLIARYAHELFPGFVAEESACFRVIRNWDLEVDEEEAEDLMHAVEAELRRRDRGAAVRLEIVDSASANIEMLLRDALGLEADDVFRYKSPLGPQDLSVLAKEDLRRELRIEPFTPVTPTEFGDAESTFDLLREQDVLLHHPYDSFEPVVRFIEEAAEDPRVLAIKQTFYRTSGDSPFVRALSRAAENGKQVAALVEIKARFDEQNNIEWARRLEESGVHVVYGLVGLKTHCKAALVVRREDQGIRSYVHLGTGNYNPQTARGYTDLSFMTAREPFAEDVAALFNMLTGLSDAPTWRRLSVAPINLESEVLRHIEREIQRSQAGEPCRIRAKMNSLVDPVAIRALYRASQAGVPVELLVRGICCLRPGLAGVSENIRVVSIVDRFLEHSRVFAFGPDGRETILLSSADWMPRNFRRRVEAMFPIDDPKLKTRIMQEIFEEGLADNESAHELRADGTYKKVPSDKKRLRSQYRCMDRAKQDDLLAAESLALTPVRKPHRRNRDRTKPKKKKPSRK